MPNPEKRGLSGRSPEGLIFPEAYYTWYHLQDTSPKGKLIGLSILLTILRNPSLKRMVIMGAPGVGKTVLAKQAAEILKIASLDVESVQFDDVLADVEKKLAQTKPEMQNRSNWQESEWDIFSERMLDRVRRPSSSKQEGKRRFQIVELVAIGWRFNRAISTLDALVKDRDLLVVGVPADLRNQMKSWKMRALFTPIHNKKTGQVEWFNPAENRMIPFNLTRAKDLLEQNFGTRVIWLTTKKPSTSAEEGAIILEALRRMAAFEGIKRINEDVRFQSEEMLLAEGKTSADLPSLPPLPEAEPSLMLKEAVETYQMNIYHMQKRMGDLQGLGLPKNRGFVALNPYSNRLVYWYF